MQMQIVHVKGNTKKMQRIRRLSVALTVAGGRIARVDMVRAPAKLPR